MTAPAATEPQPERAPRDLTRQLSFSGTPRMGDGSTRPDDYVSELANPRTRMEAFEEMRNDGAVNTALVVREKHILSANWMLQSADDTPKGRQIKEFVEDNLYPLLDDILRQLAGAIHYGVGLFEPIYAWADGPFATTIARGKLRRAAVTQGRQLYLRKIARIRQRAIWTFQISETGDLELVRQYVYNGTGLARRDIPGEKLVRWTYDMQGDDYWGVPPTRSAYKAWQFKRQLESLNLLGIDRFGVGTPVGVAGPGWADAEYARAYEYIRAWRASTQSGLLIPDGGSLSLVAGEGTLFAALLEVIKWYHLEIAKTYLTQGTELGSTNTGARALGETMQEQSEGVAQADCEALAGIVNEQIVVPLVRWNFGPQPVYPAFAPSQRVRASSAIGTLIKDWVEKKVIDWRAEDEQWLRDANGMPDIDVKARQAEMDAEEEARQAAADALAKATQQGQGGGDGVPTAGQSGTDEGRGSGRGLGRGGRGVARRAPRALSADAAPLPYRTRESHAWEMAVVRPEIVGRDLDIETARTAGEVRDVLRAIDLALALMVMRAAAKGVASLADSIAEIAVAAALEEQLRSALTDAAERARDYGARTVRAEVARQAQPEGVGPGAFPGSTPAPVEMPADAPTPEAIAEQRDHVLAAEIDRAVAEEIGRRTAAARGAARDAIAQAGAREPEELATVAKANAETALEELSPARTQQNVGGVVNVAFGAGRGDGADDIRDGGGEFKSKVYSAVMDGGTCEECAKWDGAEFPIDFPEDLTGVQAPNPRCAGGYSRCRCVWIYVAASESAPTLPASKGPTA